MASVNPYLNFEGNCEEAFNFYKSVFGGEFQSLMRYKDAPAPNQSKDESEKIIHVSLPIGEGTILMVTSWRLQVGGFGFSVSGSVDFTVRNLIPMNQ